MTPPSRFVKPFLYYKRISRDIKVCQVISALQEYQSRYRCQGLSSHFCIIRESVVISLSRFVKPFLYFSCGACWSKTVKWVRAWYSRSKDLSSNPTQASSKLGKSRHLEMLLAYLKRMAVGLGVNPRHISEAMLHCFFGLYFGKSNSEH